MTETKVQEGNWTSAWRSRLKRVSTVRHLFAYWAVAVVAYASPFRRTVCRVRRSAMRKGRAVGYGAHAFCQVPRRCVTVCLLF